MSTKILEQTEGRMSPELMAFGDLVKRVEDNIQNMNIRDIGISNIQGFYFLARQRIVNYESEILRRFDFSGMNNDRLRSYCDLLDALKERVKSKYDKLEEENLK